MYIPVGHVISAILLEMVMSIRHTLTAAECKAFDMSFADWLCKASDAELEQFELLQSKYPSNAIRTNYMFVAECLNLQDRRAMLPASLVQRLQAASWPPAVGIARAL